MAYIINETYGSLYFSGDMSVYSIEPDGSVLFRRSASITDKTLLIAAATPTYETRRPVIQPISHANRGYAYLVSGNPDPQLPSEEIQWKDKSNNAPFRKKVLSRAIVMSDYSVGRIKISFKNGSQRSGPTNTTTTSTSLIEFINPDIIHKVGRLTYYFKRVAANRYVDVKVNPIWFRRGRFNVTDTSPKPDWDLTPDLIVESLRDFQYDKGIVTSALADANRGQMDILTTIVEIPETISSVISGFNAVANLSKAAKNREFSISQGYKNRKRFLQRVFDEDMERLQRLRGSARSRAERRTVERHIQLRRRTHRRALEDTLSEFNTALANIWMNFRYNISTTIYAIEDAMDLLANLFTEFVSSRDKDVKRLLFPVPDGWTVSAEYEEIHRVLVKRRYDASGSTSTQLARHSSANIAQTLWEATSRSFVIDWFLNVGDLLIALLGLNLSEDQKSCYSVKAPLSFSCQRTSDGATVVIEGLVYFRKVINPADYVGLCWEPNITFFRQVDAIAMLWPTVRKALIRSK